MLNSILKDLKLKNSQFKNGELKLVGDCGDGYLIIQNKYGLLKIQKYSLYKNNNLKIICAINKEEYFNNFLKDKNYEISKELKCIDYNMNANCLFESKYGEVFAHHDVVLKWKKVSISSAVNKKTFWVNRNKDIRKDFDDIDYSECNYENNSIKVDLRCKKHDYKYSQRPSHHSSGINGCPHCAKQTIMYSEDNFKIHKTFFDNIRGYLYILKLSDVDGTVFYKVGITKKDRFEYRMSQYKTTFNITLLLKEEGYIENMFIFEQQILEELKHEKYIIKKKFTGHTECLKENPLNYYYNYKLNRNKNVQETIFEDNYSTQSTWELQS